jgi:hypothetical protein
MVVVEALEETIGKLPLSTPTTDAPRWVTSMGLPSGNETAMARHSTGVASSNVGAPHTELMSIVELPLPTLPHQLSWVIKILTKIGPVPSLPPRITVTFCTDPAMTMSMTYRDSIARTSGLSFSLIFPSLCVSCGGSLNHHSPQLSGSQQYGSCTMVLNPSSPFRSSRPTLTPGCISSDSLTIIPASVANAVIARATVTSVQTGG